MADEERSSLGALQLTLGGSIRFNYERRLLDEAAPLFHEKWQDVHDSLEFRAQEFGALGREVARGVGREFGNIGKGVLKESANLAVDFVTAAVTLGLAQPSSPYSKRNGRRRRR